MLKKPTYEELERRIAKLEKEAETCRKSGGKRSEETINLHVPSMDDLGDIGFEDLFVLEDLQRLQDEFASATGVASIITQTDGTPITAPSNFCRLCNDIIRSTEKGRINCFKSDAMIGRFHPEGPTIERCKSSGLWDAGAAITVGGRHIANWLIGQVRDVTQSGEGMRAYAREIGVDETLMIEAFEEVPSMSLEQFGKIAKMLFTMAGQLSQSAYLNVQQKRFIAERNKIEKALVKSEEKYRTLVESSIDLIWEVDEIGNYTYVSPQTSEIIGFEPHEVIGKSLFDFMDETEATKVRQKFMAAVENARPIVSLENVNRHKDGHSVVLETSGAPIFNLDGQLKGYRGIDRDITRRRQTEKSLLESEERFRQIFENIRVGIAIYEAADNGDDFVFKDINPYGVQSGEKSREDHIGKSVLNVYPGVKEIGLFDVFKEVWKTGHARHHPVSQYQDGRITLWVENFVSRLPSGEVMAVYEDMTNERKAQAALRDSEKQLRATLDATPFPIAMVDLEDDTIHFWSHSALDLFGHTAPTASEWYEIAYPDPHYRQEAIEQRKPFLEKAAESGQPVNTGEYHITCKDGSVRICQIYATFLPKNLIITFNDITQQKQAENKLKEYQEHLEDLVKRRTAALEEKNKELETFTYSVSHDLKAPLRGIDGYSRLLVEEYSEKLDDEGLLFLSNVRQSATQMNQLIEDLLAYSRMERRQLQPVSIELGPMIDMMISQRTRDIEEGSIRISLNLPFKTVTTDPETLRQVLANYLDNAIKFSKKDASGAVEIGGKEAPGSWTLWVKDNGIGFDPQYQDRIFNIFQRLHRSEDYPGTGVGLAIVRKAVERIGGRVWAESEIDNGATFFITISK